MGKRLPKAELLQEIHDERRKLDHLLRELSPRQMVRRNVTRAGWSVKDILGHLVSWQQMNLDWYDAGLRGDSPQIPAPGLSWKDIRELNDRIYRRHRQRSLQAVVSDYHKFHQKMLQLIDGVSDETIVAIGHFAWTGPSWSLSDYIRANTASHYRWAGKHIRQWSRANRKPTT